MQREDELEIRKPILRDDEGNLIAILRTVSVVSDPAIELDFKLFNKVDGFQYFKADEELMEITGPALVPGKFILRIDDQTKKYYNMVFSEADVKDSAEVYIAHANHNIANFEHNQESYTDKIRLLYSWIVEDPKNDRANALGFNMSEIPKGTWFVTYKVLDKELWALLKKSDFKGFSIELAAPEKTIESFSEVSLVTEIDKVLESAPTVIKGKYSLLYNLIKDIMFDEKITDENKYKIVRKLLTKL